MTKQKAFKRLACMLASLFVAGATACDKEKEYELEIYLPETKMAIVHEKVSEYLQADFEESYELVSTNKNQHAAAQYSYLSFGGKYCSEYKIRVSQDKKFKNYFDLFFAPQTELTKYTVNLRILIPNTKYYVKVMALEDPSICSKVESFVTEDCVVRPLDITDTDNFNGPKNVRDVGGWSTNDGKKIKYGMIYRGTYLNQRSGDNDPIKLREYGRYIMKNCLGIKTEVDLRTSGKDDVDSNAVEKTPQTVNMISPKYPYYKLTLLQYDDLWIPVYQETCETSLKAFFALLADETQYPMYVHCNQGADRTGTLFYLLEGLLGVSYEDAVRDFELTSFSISGLRLRDEEQPVFGNHVRWGIMHKKIMTYGETYQSAVEAYLLSIGVSSEQIKKIKDILLTD
ncbi:MAG: tyrosine-protein phosphatase [Clostridia bacterium]|nr:tyrosine-protein phosphatase [Clostridia bacterium]